MNVKFTVSAFLLTAITACSPILTKQEEIALTSIDSKSFSGKWPGAEASSSITILSDQTVQYCPRPLKCGNYRYTTSEGVRTVKLVADFYLKLREQGDVMKVVHINPVFKKTYATFKRTN